VLSALLFAVALIQLIEAMVHLHRVTVAQAGRWIYLTLWLQVMVLSVGVYWYLRTPVALLLAVVYTGLFVWALTQTSGNQVRFSVQRGPLGYLEWTQTHTATATATGTGQQQLLGDTMGAVYVVGLFAPWLVLEQASGWRDRGLWTLMLVLALSAAAVRLVYPQTAFPTLWCYSAVVVAATAWLIQT